MITDNERWLLSFYRTSEITGALFFGRLAKIIPAGPLQKDMTKHFADESQHAWLWTKALDDVGHTAIRQRVSYQDQYLETAGAPANMMEVLAVTQIFEQRVLNQYTKHLRMPNIHPVIESTLRTIMEDEKWHIQWIRDALRDAETRWGADTIAATIQRFRDADREVYAKTMQEHEERIGALM